MQIILFCGFSKSIVFIKYLANAQKTSNRAKLCRRCGVNTLRGIAMAKRKPAGEHAKTNSTTQAFFFTQLCKAITQRSYVFYLAAGVQNALKLGGMRAQKKRRRAECTKCTRPSLLFFSRSRLPKLRALCRPRPHFTF